MRNNSASKRVCRFLHAIVIFGISNGWAPAVSAQSATTAVADVADRPRRALNADIEERIDELIQELTLAEKIGQLCQANAVGGGVTGPEHTAARDSLHELIRNGQIGSILNEVQAASSNKLQKLAVEESRLGVPLIFGRDVVHGFRTIAPIPLAQAASWNPKLVEEAAA